MGVVGMMGGGVKEVWKVGSDLMEYKGEVVEGKEEVKVEGMKWW